MLSFVLSVALGPLAGKTLGSLFWFSTYHATIMPVLAVAPVFIAFGASLPLFVYRAVSRRTIVERLLSYRNVAKQTIVERLRETE